MKPIKFTITLLIAILFVLPDAGFAQVIDKKSEDAKKAESGISAQEKEKQEQTDQSTFSTKDNDDKKKKEDQVKETSSGAFDHPPGHVKKKDVEEAKEKAHVSVKNTENAVLGTEQRIAVAKEKIEDVRLRLDEKMKAGTITEQEYHEKMVRISQAEERLISLELEMNADKEKINQTKKFIDQPAQK